MPFRLSCSLIICLTFLLVGEVWAQEEGYASYYHVRLQGRMSASGVRYDNSELTTAHRTYPFGTFLRVTNLSNMKRVVVCVTDRGPFRKKRILDLSYEAAKQLDFIAAGIAKVRVEVVPAGFDLSVLDLIPPPPPFLDLEKYSLHPPCKLEVK